MARFGLGSRLQRVVAPVPLASWLLAVLRQDLIAILAALLARTCSHLIADRTDVALTLMAALTR